MCIGIRPKDSNAFYDIGYFSMIDWESEPLKWKSKDGFYNDLNSYCGYGFDYNSPNYLPEEDKWITLKVSASALKNINRKGISAVIKEARANGILTK